MMASPKGLASPLYLPAPLSKANVCSHPYINSDVRSFEAFDQTGIADTIHDKLNKT